MSSNHNEKSPPAGNAAQTLAAADAVHDPRLEQLGQWLQGLFGSRDFEVTTASADASFRRYFRVHRAGDTWIAMDAPPGK